jgi:hypothetical protein
LAAAELALDVTARTIDPLPDQINRRIFEIAQKLPLDRLLDPLRSVNGGLSRRRSSRQSTRSDRCGLPC